MNISMDSLPNLDSLRNLEHKKVLIAALAGVPIVTFVYRRLTRSSRDSPRNLSSFPLPPGPKRDPIIGSVRSFPQDRWYETFCSWQKTYGDMIYVNLMGTSMLITNSLKVARDLTEKRGHIYSGRQKDIMLHKVLGWEWDMVFADPGQFHTDCRTIMKKAVGQNEVVSQDFMIEKEAKEFVKDMGAVNGDPWNTILHRVGATIIKTTYGESIYRAHGAELTEMNHEAVGLLTWVFTQFWFVNYIPILHYFPDWIPMPFKKVGKKGKALQERVHYFPWEQTLKHYQQGIAEPSIALTYIENGKNLDTARDAIGIMYSAGVDNTASTIMSFVAAILANPHVQAKIHAELDREIPMGTTPTYSDRPHLKYLDAAWRESIRMNPSSPLGAPHLALQADVYEGMYIPKGTLVFTNLGFMLRDTRIWGADANTYRPERWLEPGASSLPDDVAFGFGRRVCPGRYFAERIGFTYVVNLLKTYEILPVEGEVAPREFPYLDAAVRRPEGVRCRFRPRHAGHYH